MCRSKTQDNFYLKWIAYVVVMAFIAYKFKDFISLSS